MTEIKIGGRTVPLLYTTYEMIAIQEEIGCTAYQLRDEVFDIHMEDEDDPSSMTFGIVNDPKKTKKLGTLIRILGNAGLEEKGEEADLTDKWVLRQIRPALILPYCVAVLAEHQPVIVFFEVDGLALLQGAFAEEAGGHKDFIAFADGDAHLAPLFLDGGDYVHEGISFCNAHCSRALLLNPRRPSRASLHPPLRKMTWRPVPSS